MYPTPDHMLGPAWRTDLGCDRPSHISKRTLPPDDGSYRNDYGLSTLLRSAIDGYMSNRKLCDYSVLLSAIYLSLSLIPWHPQLLVFSPSTATIHNSIFKPS